ncbi:glycosyl transferase [Hoeflea sp. WL0058]|uniref:Glycosyl transferase n=1 Tax=Flavimaribacter sediminis TaxID=2865987 RepID=A0AAE3D0L3_9HYPH|nr:glycosyl transferase [Flavimaribacter sediminis]
MQHLLGVGHVFRTMRIVERLVATGFEVTIAHGGEKIPDIDSCGADIRYLPSLRWAAADDTRLLDADGRPADDTYKDMRRNALLQLLQETRPDVIITEAFPFGRRQMHFELLPFLEAASALAKRPIILASIRDILQEGNKPSKDMQTVEIIEQFFDGVLVHGDARLTPLETTFPFVDKIRDKLHYTGIVTPRINLESEPQTRFDVVVTAGGGMLGRELIRAALFARESTNLKDARWCVCAGPYMALEEFNALGELAGGGNVTLRRFLPDLPAVLSKAELSISLAGYNTVADLMAAGCRAVIAPQWNNKETEQLRRAELLSQRGLVEMVGHEEKTPAMLAEAIRRVMAKPVPDWRSIETEGAARTAETLSRLISGSSNP